MEKHLYKAWNAHVHGLQTPLTNATKSKVDK